MNENKIKPSVSREAGYVYHMLSCAKCGYDNSYGKQFAPLHNNDNMKTLNEHEKLITVKGGEHFGQLYWLLVCLPASLNSLADKFYQTLYFLFHSKGVYDDGIKFFAAYGFENMKDVYSKWEIYDNEIVSISKIMMENYHIYVNNIWNDVYPKLFFYAEQVKKAFEENMVSVKFDELMGITPTEAFYPIFCDSLEGGAEAIDLSKNQHVFGIGRDVETTVQFVSHEYVIYLLKHVLEDTPADNDPMKYWLHTESIAAYYQGKVFPGEHVFLRPERREIVKFYESINRNGKLSARELLFAAINR